MMQFSIFVQMTSFLLFSSFNKFNADMLFIFFFVVHSIVCVCAHNNIDTSLLIHNIELFFYFDM